MSIQPITAFNPVTDPTGTFDNSIGGKCITVRLLNESLETFWVQSSDGLFYALVPALWAEVFTVANPPGQFTYVVFASQNAQDTTIQQVQGVIYSQEEDTSKLYSGPLPRIANVGNPGSVSSTVSGGTLVNTGNAPNTQVGQVASSANPGNTWTLTNDGLMQLAVTIAGALVTVLQTLEPAAINNDIIRLGAVNYIAHILGALSVDGALVANGDVTINGVLTPNTIAGVTNTGNETIAGTLGVTGATQITGALTALAGLLLGNLNNAGLDVSDASHIKFTPPATGGFQFNKASGTAQSVFFDETNGFSITSSLPLKFSHWAAAHVSAIIFFSGTGSGTFTHGLATVTPAIIIIETNVTGGGSQTDGVSSYTTTNCVVTTGAGLAWKGVAIAS